MSDSTTRHDHAEPFMGGPAGHTAPDTALAATFQEPDVVRGLTTREVINRGGEQLMNAVRRHTTEPYAYDGQAPTGEVPAEPAPPAGPAPLLEGTFAIFVTPEESIVVAYRPRGATEDKHFVVPTFIVAMATQHSGHTPAEIFQALKDGGV